MSIDYGSDISLWFKQSGEEGHKSLITLAEASEEDNQPRRNRAAYNSSIFQGIGMSGFGSWSYGRNATNSATVNGENGKVVPLVWNYAAQGLDTIQAKITGRENYKPMVQVTDGDWDDHRQSVWSGRMLDGLYSEEQGMFHNVWDMGRHAFKLAAGCTGTMAVKIVGYPHENKLSGELHDTLDMFVDSFECNYSNPLTYGEKTWFDPLRLMACFDSKVIKQQIWDAREPVPESRGGGTDGKTRYMVQVFEGWRCTMSNEPGKYLSCTKNGVLIERKYPYSTPPYAFLHARRSDTGFFGIPMMQRGIPIVEKINQILATLNRGERLMPRSMLIFDPKGTPTELMKNVRDVMMVPHVSETGAAMPQYVTPQIFDQTVMQLLKEHINAFYETIGVNSTEMSSQKAPGVTSAVAIRTVADLMSELFSVLSQDYIHFLTKDIGTLFLREASEMVKTNPDFAVTWKGNGAMKSIKASRGIPDMSKKKLIFSVQPTSGTRNTPADRIALADEMLARQELTPEAHARVIQTGDLPAEIKVSQTQQDMIAQAIDSWLYDDMEDISNISPLPWMNQAGAIVQVLDAYMSALMTAKFDVNREIYFRRYITQCSNYMKRQALEKAQLSGEVPMAPQAAPTGEVPVQ